MARTTFFERRGPILERLYRRACIRIGVLQCVFFGLFLPRNLHAPGRFGFLTSLVCIELVLFGIARERVCEMAFFFSYFFLFLSVLACWDRTLFFSDSS